MEGEPQCAAEAATQGKGRSVCLDGGISLVAQMVKNPPAMQERDLGLILGWKGPLEKGMATHSSVLPWRIPWTEEPGELQSMGSQRVGRLNY